VQDRAASADAALAVAGDAGRGVAAPVIVSLQAADYKGEARLGVATGLFTPARHPTPSTRRSRPKVRRIAPPLRWSGVGAGRRRVLAGQGEGCAEWVASFRGGRSVTMDILERESAQSQLVARSRPLW
jgi:hypothetical protein